MPAQIMENHIRMKIALDEINRIKLISEPVVLLLYIIMTNSSQIVAAAKRLQALAVKMRSNGEGKAMFEISFKLESSNDIKAIIKDK